MGSSHEDGVASHKAEQNHQETTTDRMTGPVELQAEKRVLRKMDLHVLPILCALYLLSFLDRSNIGNARTAGMARELHLDGDKYDWLLTIFYIAYILGQCQGFMWKLMAPHRWAAFIVLFWGVIASCQSAVQTWGGEMALRFLLGWAEAGFGPSVPYLLSFFYLRHELGTRIGIFISMAPLATTFAGALAYGITSGNSSLAPWRLLFLVEGLPTALMAAVAFFFLADSPTHMKSLTEEEKSIAKNRGVRQVGDVDRTAGIELKDIRKTLLDPKAWLTALMYFSCNVPFSSLPVFLPTILEEMGFTSINAQGLTAPPYFAAFLVTLTAAWLSDRLRQRGLFIFVLSIIGGIGYIILATVQKQGVQYFAVFLAACGVFPSITVIIPWTINNQGSDTRRGMGIVILNLVGQCGPLLGTRMYPTGDAPRFVKGHSVCAAFIFFNAILAISLRTLLVWENRKLDKKYGEQYSQAEQGSKQEKVEPQLTAQENYGSHFRYVL